VVVQANWRDNPWFPDVLKEERKLDLQHYPERCDHIWEGGYATAFEGAYFASVLAQAKNDGRISKVSADPLLPLRAFIDIGGAGATADAFTIWIVQWVGQEIRVLDYYEAVGQVLGEHIAWLRKRGYGNALIHLPHDGVNENNITGKRYADHFRMPSSMCRPRRRTRGGGLPHCGSRRCGVCFRNAGLTLTRRKRDAMPWATTTNARTSSAMSGLVLNMIGQAMLLMGLA
jgi:phage terminase large subunit